MKRLLLLVRAALRDDPLDATDVQEIRSWSQGDWADLLELAREQSVTGLVYQALSLWPEQEPPAQLSEDQFYTLVSRADHIERRSGRMTALSQALVARLQSAGLHPQVLKGPVTAGYYPRPAFREYGDVDLYLPAGELPTLAATVPEGVRKPDGSFHFEQEGVDVDVHPNWLDLPYAAKGLPAWPAPEAQLLMLSAHILKHATGAGVGLRQVVDMAAAYRKLDYSPDALKALYKSLHLERWNRLLCSFLARYLDTPNRLYPEDRLSPEPLMRIVREGGNFGHHAASRSRALSRSAVLRKADTALCFLRRLPFSLRYGPRLAFSAFSTLVKGNLHRAR